MGSPREVFIGDREGAEAISWERLCATAKDLLLTPCVSSENVLSDIRDGEEPKSVTSHEEESDDSTLWLLLLSLFGRRDRPINCWCRGSSCPPSSDDDETDDEEHEPRLSLDEASYPPSESLLEELSWSSS